MQIISFFSYIYLLFSTFFKQFLPLRAVTALTLTPAMVTDPRTATVTTVVLTPVMHAELRPAAVTTATLIPAMVTDPSTATVTTVILHFAMFTPLIVRGALEEALDAFHCTRHRSKRLLYNLYQALCFFVSKNRLNLTFKPFNNCI